VSAGRSALAAAAGLVLLSPAPGGCSSAGLDVLYPKRQQVDKPSDAARRETMEAALARTMHDLATDATLNRVLRPPEHAVDSTLAAGLSLPGSSYRGRT
jgi:hypothetical protein